MTLVKPIEQARSIRAIGALGRPNGYGRVLLGWSRFGEFSDIYAIYSLKKTKKGKRVSRMRHYRPTNPQSPTQQAWRTVFANGKAAWDSLTEEEKYVYNRRAIRLKFSGYNLFQREYLRSHA